METLIALVEQARHYEMSEEEREAQLRSFAFGNVHLANGVTTREDIGEVAERLKALRCYRGRP